MVIERPHVLWCMMARCLRCATILLSEIKAVLRIEIRSDRMGCNGKAERFPCQDVLNGKMEHFVVQHTACAERKRGGFVLH